MSSFKKRITTGSGSSPEFSFNSIHTANGFTYHISVLDQDKQPCAFSMERKGHNWKIVNAPKPADWIIALEADLQKAIEESGEG